MSPSPTMLLMLCMLAATVLGGAVGACLWHLRSASRFRQALGDTRRRAEAERRGLEAAFGEERERAAARHAEALDALARTQHQVERARAGHRELVAHARQQGRRIDALEAEAEIVAYAARRSPPRHGTEIGPPARAADHPSASGSRPAAARNDEDLPVLNRRVRVGAVAAVRAESRPERAIGSVLAVPAPFEPESPDEEERAPGVRYARDRASDD